MRYIPALDGMRALAVMAVVVQHSWIEGIQGGYIGVDVFFVLSGLLITRVLIENPALGRFYLRRTKRLVPPLLLMLAAYLALFPIWVPDYPHGRDAALAFFYLSDFSFALYQVPKYLGHTWSLSIEEHFYLLWPIILLRLKPSVGFLLALYIIVTGWRWMALDWMGAYYRLDMHSSGLILGCVLALLPAVRFPAWPGLTVLAVLFICMDRNASLTQGPGIMLAEIAAAVSIVGTAPAWLQSRSLVYLGKLSYGVYLWHFPLSLCMHENRYSPATVLAVTMTASVTLAALSYHTIERLFRTPAAPVQG